MSNLMLINTKREAKYMVFRQLFVETVILQL